MEVASIKRGPLVRFRSTKLRGGSKCKNVVRSARFGNGKKSGVSKIERLFLFASIATSSVIFASSNFAKWLANRLWATFYHARIKNRDETPWKLRGNGATATRTLITVRAGTVRSNPVLVPLGLVAFHVQLKRK